MRENMRQAVDIACEKGASRWVIIKEHKPANFQKFCTSVRAIYNFFCTVPDFLS